MDITNKLKAIGDAIREKTGKTDPMQLADMPAEIAGISTGGGASSVSPKEVNFYDYDGTCLYAYTVEEAQAMSELPALPERDGLICQGWNWNLDDIKAHNRALNVGATYTTDDGTTRIYIHLEEGRTSPMLGVCPNGTVTVDWGDGTAPDVLTGTSTSTVQWTPTHEYGEAGDYVIRLTVDGAMDFRGYDSSLAGTYLLRYKSSEDERNFAYRSAVRKVEIGVGVQRLRVYAFQYCQNLTSITIPNSVTEVGDEALSDCHNLPFITIPNSVTTIGGSVFHSCFSLSSVAIPNGVRKIVSRMFHSCYNLTSVTIPNSVTEIGSYAFYYCYTLASITIPNSVTKIDYNAFDYCRCMTSITIPNSVTEIGSFAFNYWHALASITIPNSVTTIGAGIFCYCYSVRYFDFTNHTVVPTLSNTNAFSKIPADCEIRVPSALYGEWIAATNWATLASQIVAV